MNSGVCKWCGLEVSGEPVMAGERFMTLIWDWTRTRVHDLKPPRKSPLRRGCPRKVEQQPGIEPPCPENGQEPQPESSEVDTPLVWGLAATIEAVDFMAAH